MYSIIPVPSVKWNENTMKYAMCFFPFVGVVIGIFVYLFNYMMRIMRVNVLLYSSIMTLTPILISGCIHLDGFIDTCDARYSRQNTERKLEILKDPHVGAFGIISCCCYLLVSFGIYGQFYDIDKNILILCLGFVLSRTLSAMSIVTFKLAKNTGLAYIFAGNADKKAVRSVLCLLMAAIIIVMLIINFKTSLILLLTVSVWFFIYKQICMREFGGITGDLAGFFLTIAEFLVLVSSVVGGYI